MTEYRVELQALTTKVVTVEAADSHTAMEKAMEYAYDDVDEVDRTAWMIAAVGPT